MMKSPITHKAASSVEQCQQELGAQQQRAKIARQNLKTSKSALLSKKSALFALFAAGTYFGSRPKVIKVTDPKQANSKPFSLYSLINTALSLIALQRKTSFLLASRKSSQPPEDPISDAKI